MHCYLCLEYFIQLDKAIERSNFVPILKLVGWLVTKNATIAIPKIYRRSQSSSRGISERIQKELCGK